MAWRAQLLRQWVQQSLCHGTVTACCRRATTTASRKPRRSTKLYSELPESAIDTATGKPLSALEPFVSKSRRTRRSVAIDQEPNETLQKVEQTIEIPQILDLGPQGQEWPRLAKDVLTNITRFPGCVLLTRVGGFYESYFDQAPLLAGMLSIKLANRSWGGRSVPMAGFPLSQLEKYLKVLVQENRKLVAVCEEFRPEDEGQTLELNKKVEIVRRVTRVVSPGTLIDEKWIDPLQNNFILSIASDEAEQNYGLAWLDLSTSDLHVSFCEDLESLRDEVNRILPSEVVLPQGGHIDINQVVDVQRTLLSFLPDLPRVPALSPLEAEASQAYRNVERMAMVNLTTHLRGRLLEIPADVIMAPSLARHHVPQDSMAIDSNTLDALEIRETSREGSLQGSLVSTVRRTLTRGGSRLLVDWLTSPSTSYETITRRHSAVAYLVDHHFVHEDWRTLFRTIQRVDIKRTLQKIATARNDEQDLLEVRDFIRFIAEVKGAVLSLQEPSFGADEGLTVLTNMIESFVELKQLGVELGEAIDESVMEKRLRTLEALERDDPENAQPKDAQSQVVTTRAKKSKDTTSNDDPWGSPFEHLIRPASSKQLTRLTREYQRLRNVAAGLQKSLRKRFDSPKVSLRLMLGQGFVVHFAGVNKVTDNPRGLTVAAKTKSTCTFYHEPWSHIGARLLRLQNELKKAENAELRRLRLLVLNHGSALRRNAQIADELDCLMGFAQLAADMRLVRPKMVDLTIHDDAVFQIEAGRHIGVERGLLERGRHFTPNNLNMTRDSRLHFVTGPNMGGKSTYLRQNALICILAQAGSFVPAGSARLSIVDRIFARVGAKDDLFRDRSTFMVEMLETAEILRRATRRSFVVADEIGRGTTTQVGVAIAFATLKTLGDIGCRTIFATHLHELADLMCYDEAQKKALDEDFRHVRFASTDVRQTEFSVTYSHRIRTGVNRESHGLTVAALAGIPAEALEIARQTLRRLSTTQLNHV